MKGIIIQDGFSFYTDMNAVTAPIKQEFSRYHWLITQIECNQYPDPRIRFDDEYVWMDGGEFLDLVEKNDIQFIWAVFSAFPKEIPFSKVMEQELPYADGYTGFWKNPISIQHPLAVAEIVPWDSSLILAISENEDMINLLMEAFPQAVDLEQYNREF